MRCHAISVLSLIAIAAVPLANHAKPTSRRWDNMNTKHSLKTVPENWESLGHPPTGATINLYVALKPDRETALIDALHEVSDPGHPKYGAHLSKEQVANLVSPHPDTLELVHSWLRHHGIPLSSISTTHGGNTITLTGLSITQADELLSASYKVYRHVETNQTIVRTIGYSLPASLYGHVWTVAPTTHFASPHVGERTLGQRLSGRTEEPAMGVSGESVTGLSGHDDGATTPTFLRWLYNTWGYTPAATSWNRLAIVGFLLDYPSFTDLAAFMQKYRSDGVDATYSAVLINHGNSKYDPSIGNGNGEANLDLQYAQGMAYPTPLVFYSIGLGFSGTEDGHLAWLGNVIEQLHVPQTISISYSTEEKEYSNTYADYICFLFAQLAARGASVLGSTGNDGVGKDCTTSGGFFRLTTNLPATCPYITAVGGTTNFLPEVAAALSGGGFSEHFPRPPYQLLAAHNYLQELGDRYEGLFNNFGRGVPDISAQALGFRIFNNSLECSTQGTSGSVPIVAGIFSLLNDYLLSKGKAPLGFLNPWLYSLPIRGLPGLNDITIGSNPGCGTRGFPAVPGWDPVTGLGTPNFEVLRQVLELELPWRPNLV